MSGGDRFVLLLAGLVTIATGIAGMLAVLIRLTYKIGSLVERLNEHVEQSGKIHQDQEQRIRRIEQSPPQVPRYRR